jgi:hypothetical protein
MIAPMAELEAAVSMPCASRPRRATILVVMHGEDKAWEHLAACDPSEVCARAGATYHPGSGYTLPVFGFAACVDPAARVIQGPGPELGFLLEKAGHFTRLAVLSYLLHARSMEPTGRLVSPAGLKDAQFYSGGSHALPLERIAARFAGDPVAFVAQAARFGGEQMVLGDAAVELRPLPRVAITLVLRLGDEEFPASSSLLFEETSVLQVPPDVLWSVALLCVMVMLH